MEQQALRFTFRLEIPAGKALVLANTQPSQTTRASRLRAVLAASLL